ncbi:MAG: hypothetical protein GY934_10185 [Gammaproteobacteria bacterium]|nr:hypothetical protein [Gammaproteobacteria bacterium]
MTNDYMDERNEGWFCEYTKRLTAASASGDPVARERVQAPLFMQDNQPATERRDDGYCSYLKAS